MKILITTATLKEHNAIVAPLLGDLNLHKIATTITGIGQTNAAIVVMREFNLLCNQGYAQDDLVCINVGVSGGNAAAYYQSPTALIDRVYNNDFDTSAVDGNAFQKEFIDLSCVGRYHICYTQDHFCTDPRELPRDIPAFVDMELFAIAKVCRLFGHRLIGIKSISDVVGSKDQKEQYMGLGFGKSCERAQEILIAELSKLL